MKKCLHSLSLNLSEQFESKNIYYQYNIIVQQNIDKFCQNLPKLHNFLLNLVKNMAQLLRIFPNINKLLDFQSSMVFFLFQR